MANETLNTAMASISGIVAFLGFCWGVWKYFKNKLAEFDTLKAGLQGLRETTETTMQLQGGPGKVERQDVRGWLDEADVEISQLQSVEDLVKQKGIWSFCYRTGIVMTRTAELNKILQNGEKFRGMPQLVDDDASLEWFTEQKEKLKLELREVEVRLRSQRGHGKIETERVKVWLEAVEEIINGQTATDIETNFSNVPQPVEFPNLVKQKIREMKELRDKGAQLPEILVIEDPSAAAPPMLTPELQGNHDVKEEILRLLMGDETAKIGVWGMGGVGKTTIMMHVYNQLLNLKESKFKKVVWVTVSEKFDAGKIQDEIARILKGEESLSNHKESRLRAAALSQILEMHKPYVLILDDVWESFELHELGIPEIPGCKLVLTTRSEEIVRTMDCEPVKVNILSWEDSLQLFKDTAGVVELQDDGGPKGTLEEMVDQCGGLPLAIKAVAASMKRISDPHLWRHALKKLKEGSVPGAKYDPFRALKFSYDRLENPNIQQCFLQCVLYPEDEMILKEDLIDCWIDGELIVVDGTLRAMKDEGHSILNKLVGNCLLESVRDYFGRDCVRMHDLMRTMALRITRTSDPRFLVKAGKGLRELPGWNEWKGDLSKVSLMSNYITIVDIPPSLPSPRCPILTTLLLSHNSRISTIPENFFEHMPELKVLDLSYNLNLTSLPSSVSKLVKLTTLLLRCCKSLEELPSLSNLAALKKLDLFEAELGKVPHGLGKLLNLKYLDIRRGLRREDTAEWIRSVSGILSNLSELQHLVLDPRVPVEGEQLGGIWPELESFCGSFRTWRDMSSFLNNRQNRLYDYNIYAGDPNNAHLSLSELKCISCYDCGEPGLIPSDVERLSIWGCNDVRNLKGGFGKLKKLELRDLENLKGLSDSEAEAAPPLADFSSLEEIFIYKCPKINKLFPTTWQKLPNLKEVSVRKCSQLEEIMVASSSSKLEKLTLENLPVLKSISSPTVASVFGCLKELGISECPNLNGYIFGGQFKFSSLHSLETLRLLRLRSLKSIFHEEVDESHAPTVPFPLRVLVVEGCPQLKKIFPHAVQIDSFQNLEQIRVYGCDKLEEIMAVSSEREEDQSKPILPKLAYLSLIELPVLKRICSVSVVPDSLRYLTIQDCPDLNWKCLFSSRKLPQALEFIRLKGVRDLELIYDDGEASDSLAFFRSASDATTSSSLEGIWVENCPQLKRIFTFGGRLDCFRYLFRIEVNGCDGLEEIMATSLQSEENQSKLILPALEILGLTNLPALKRFCGPIASLVPDSGLTIEHCLGLCWELPQKLRSLSLKGVRNIVFVFVEEASDSLAFWRLPPAATSTFALRDITVANCPQLKRIFSHAGLLDSFENIRSIEVQDCDELEEIISAKSEEESIKVTHLPKLGRFHLCNLPKLKRVCTGTSASICDSLKYPITFDCPKLEWSFSPLPKSSPPRDAAESSTRNM